MYYQTMVLLSDTAHKTTTHNTAGYRHRSAVHLQPYVHDVPLCFYSFGEVSSTSFWKVRKKKRKQKRRKRIGSYPYPTYNSTWIPCEMYGQRQLNWAAFWMNATSLSSNELCDSKLDKSGTPASHWLYWMTRSWKEIKLFEIPMLECAESQEL